MGKIQRKCLLLCDSDDGMELQKIVLDDMQGPTKVLADGAGVEGEALTAF